MFENLMFSIHCAIEDLDKLESGGYYADCAKADKAPQVILKTLKPTQKSHKIFTHMLLFISFLLDAIASPSYYSSWCHGSVSQS